MRRAHIYLYGKLLTTIMHLGINSVTLLATTGTLSETARPVLGVGVLLRTLFILLYTLTEGAQGESIICLRRRYAFLEELVCFPLKETVNLRVIKIAFKEVTNAN